MDENLWKQLLKEADKNGDGVVSYDEFSLTMNEMVRKSWLRECDQSPSRSKSPIKMNLSPDRENSPLKKKKGGLIISPERNPFNRNKNRESPQKN